MISARQSNSLSGVLTATAYRSNIIKVALILSYHVCSKAGHDTSIYDLKVFMLYVYAYGLGGGAFICAASSHQLLLNSAGVRAYKKRKQFL